MAVKTKTSPNGNRLEEALATLISNQAALASNQIAFSSQMARMKENYAAIRRELGQIKSLLIHHEEILNALPEAIRQKIGFAKAR